MNSPRIIKPGDKDFAPPRPMPGPTNAVKISPEIQSAFAHLHKTLAGQLPELVPHLVTGGTIRIKTNSGCIVELPFAGLVGRI